MIYCEKLFADLNRLAVSHEGEKLLVRELASRVAELARSPRMASIKKRWRDVLALRKPDRPPVWCNPVGCWKEILPDSSLVCKSQTHRELEIYFKKLLVKNEIGDDTPINDYYTINAIFDVSPSNVWGIGIEREKLDEIGAAWKYKAALAAESDFDRLVVPHYELNRTATEAAVVEICDALGDILPVRVSPITGYYSGGTICNPAADLRGMEQIMMDMIESPQLVHRLMKTVYLGEMSRLDAIEEADNIFPNTDSAMFMSDPLRENNWGIYGLEDCWIHGNSQEFDLISPDMFNEFLLEYQKKIFARFGATCYGCCENLTHKLDYVLTIPNLRLLTCSAWTDLLTLVNKSGNRHCVMWRHKASDVVCPDDLSDLKKNIFSQADVLRGYSYQVVLRELQTLFGHPDRLSEWTRISIEAVSK